MSINEIKIQIKEYKKQINKLEEETIRNGASIRKEIDIKNNVKIDEINSINLEINVLNKEIKLKEAQNFAEKWKRWSSYI